MSAPRAAAQLFANASAARSCVPPATTRAGTAQRAIPTITLNTYAGDHAGAGSCSTRVLEWPCGNFQHPLDRQTRTADDLVRQFDARGEIFHAITQFLQRV